jgi:hypothetical protein
LTFNIDTVIVYLNLIKEIDMSLGSLWSGAEDWAPYVNDRPEWEDRKVCPLCKKSLPCHTCGGEELKVAMDFDERIEAASNNYVACQKIRAARKAWINERQDAATAAWLAAKSGSK